MLPGYQLTATGVSLIHNYHRSSRFFASALAVAAIFFAPVSVSTLLTGIPPLEGLATLVAIRVILSVGQLMCTVSFVPNQSGF